MGKDEEEFITTFYHNVINQKTGNISYNGVRHYLSKKEINKLRPGFKSLEEILEHIKPKIQQKKHETKEGGLLPLALLIPLITGSIGAAGAATSGIATAIAKAKENTKQAEAVQEQVRHNAEMERLAKENTGQGLGNDSEDEEIEEIKYCINKLKGAGFSFI